jgi:predicted DNA-binding transcriptional regulator AlpA
MTAPMKTNDIDSLRHPAHVAKLLGVSHSWLAKSRLNGTGPRFIKVGRAVRYAMSEAFAAVVAERLLDWINIRTKRKVPGNSGRPFEG